jgi:predicted DNA-binding transcriptional regulator YafY
VIFTREQIEERRGLVLMWSDAGEPYSIHVLASDLEVSLRTIQRDLRALGRRYVTGRPGPKPKNRTEQNR